MRLKQLLSGEENNGTYMEMEVDHSGGGMNYFSGNSSSKGIYVYFRRIQIEGNFRSFTMSLGGNDGNFKIKAYEYDRKNNKKIEAVCNYISSNQELLFNLYKEQKYNDIYEFITSFNLDNYLLKEKLDKKLKVKHPIQKDIVKI